MFKYFTVNEVSTGSRQYALVHFSVSQSLLRPEEIRDLRRFCSIITNMTHPRCGTDQIYIQYTIIHSSTIQVYQVTCFGLPFRLPSDLNTSPVLQSIFATVSRSESSPFRRQWYKVKYWEIIQEALVECIKISNNKKWGKNLRKYLNIFKKYVGRK
jgi:hypothetical protein